MKKMIAAVMFAVSTMFGAHVAMADAGGIEGKLTKLTADSITITDAKGKEITGKIDDKTKKRGGEPKEGQTVELYIKGDKVTMIEIIKK